MLARAIRSMAAPHWLALFGLELAGWMALYAMAIPAEMRALSRIYGAEFWEAFCTVTPDAAGFLRLWLMWGLMSAAMMLPTAIPALATLDDLPKGRWDFEVFTAGYLAVWLGFSALVAGAQMGLFSVSLVDATGLSLSRWLSAGLLVVAGAFQFSALKEACVSRCRMPIAFFMDHWSEGPWRMGLRLGAVCLGCCWALMLLAFVGGVMSLLFMGLATLLMVFEKLPEIGAWLTRPLGYSLIAGGGAVLLGI